MARVVIFLPLSPGPLEVAPGKPAVLVTGEGTAFYLPALTGLAQVDATQRLYQVHLPDASCLGDPSGGRLYGVEAVSIGYQEGRLLLGTDGQMQEVGRLPGYKLRYIYGQGEEEAGEYSGASRGEKPLVALGLYAEGERGVRAAALRLSLGDRTLKTLSFGCGTGPKPGTGIVTVAVLLPPPGGGDVTLGGVRRRLAEEARLAPPNERGLILAFRTALSRAVLEREKLKAALPLLEGLLEEGWHVLLFLQYWGERVLDISTEEAIRAYLEEKGETTKGVLAPKVARALEGLFLEVESPLDLVEAHFRPRLGGALAYYTGRESEGALRKAKEAWDRAEVRHLLCSSLRDNLRATPSLSPAQARPHGLRRPPGPPLLGASYPKGTNTGRLSRQSLGATLQATC